MIGFKPSLESDVSDLSKSPGAISVMDYVEEMTLLYEIREMFKKMREIWEDYLMR